MTWLIYLTQNECKWYILWCLTKNIFTMRSIHTILENLHPISENIFAMKSTHMILISLDMNSVATMTTSLDKLFQGQREWSLSLQFLDHLSQAWPHPQTHYWESSPFWESSVYVVHIRATQEHLIKSRVFGVCSVPNGALSSVCRYHPNGFVL